MKPVKNILLTGATGFVGKNLLRVLERSGYVVIPFSSREMDLATVTPEFFSGLEFDHIIHCAGKTFVPDSWKDPISFFEINAIGTARILEVCRIKNVGLTYVSAFVYGNVKELPITESTPVSPNNPYALSKYQGEQYCQFYSNTFGVNVAIVRPFNIYGPDQPNHFLIPTIIQQIKEAKEIRLMDLGPRRDYIHIYDLCELVLLMVENQYTGVLNGASGLSYSVKELVDHLQKIMGTDLPVYSQKHERKNEINDTRADISKAMYALKWQPKIEFLSGLRNLTGAKSG